MHSYLLAKVNKRSTLRFLLASVPYRRQLNFTEESLQQAASSVDRLRNFATRLNTSKFPERKSGIRESSEKAQEGFERGLEDDLNTAQALAAVFDLVREANGAMDQGKFRQGDVVPVGRVLESFDAIFAVLQDHDDEKLRSVGVNTHGTALSN